MNSEMWRYRNGPQSLKNVHQKLVKVRAVGWTIESVTKLVKLINNEQKLNAMLNVLDIIIAYSLREYDTAENNLDLFSVLEKYRVQKWEKKIHQLAIFQVFPGTYVKSLSELSQEIVSLNENKSVPLLQSERLITEYKKIISSYIKKSQIRDLSDTRSINEWQKEAIKQWAEKVKVLEETGEKVSIYEKIALVKRAVEITSDKTPRIIQLLSLIILLNAMESKGRLVQINTGEGKTMTIAMFAAIRALERLKVDVITTSPELAKPQADEQTEFFSCFGLTVKYVEEKMIESDRKQAYEADIVYGSANTFQGDVLKDEYLKLGGRRGRPFHIGIVDEVDSMFIDGKNHIVMLSSPMPSLNHLEPVLAAIWIQMRQSASRILERDGKNYYLQQENTDNEKAEKETVTDVAVPFQCTKEKFLKRCIELHLRKMLRDEKNLPESEIPVPPEYPVIDIPNHLREFVTEVQLAKWIDNAIYAYFKCKNCKDYIIKNKKIAPVDAVNTGVVQLNMLWCNGTHQFLQIKHGSKICPESLTTNYISNVTFFKRYKNNLYGLTGTLGSNVAQVLLNETYNVDCIIIPPFQKRQFFELQPLLIQLEKDWLHNIVSSSLMHLRNGRGVLLIAKYIEDVENIRKIFIEDFRYAEEKVKLYKTDEDSQVIRQTLQAGEVIIATNIAGRGTDIILSDEVEKNGGLHVCVTFLPINQRVQLQNTGRTSRKGNKGTAQFILYEKELTNIDELMEARDRKESASLENARQEIAKVIVKDSIFEKFCKLLSEVSKVIVKSNDENDNKHVIDKDLSQRAVEERFAIWLKMNENHFNNETEEIALADFKNFEETILKDAQTGNLMKNPHYFILNGHRFLKDGKYEKAIEEYTKAIEIDKNFVSDAYYYRAYCRIAEYGTFPKKNEEHMKKAIDDLKETKTIIEGKLEPMLSLVAYSSSSEALREQVTHKMQLLSVQKSTINSAVGYDVDALIKELENEKELEGKSQEEIQVIDNQIKNYSEKKEEYKKGVIRQLVDNNTSIEVELQNVADFLYGEDVSTFKEEIEEWEYNGCIGCFHVAGKRPIDWYSVIGLVAFGLTQIAAGVSLAVFSSGTAIYFGYQAIYEGVGDLISAVYDGIVKRQISWKYWGIQKATSFIVSIGCFGFNAISQAAKTLISGAKQLATKGAAVLTESVKRGWEIGAHAIGSAAFKSIGNKLVEYASEASAIKYGLPFIQNQICNLIKVPLQNAFRNNNKIQQMLRMDENNRNNRCQASILQLVNNMLFPQQNTGWLWGLWTMAKNSLTGIFSYHSSKASTIITLAMLHNFIVKMGSLLPQQFMTSLNKKMENIQISEDTREENGEREVIQILNVDNNIKSSDDIDLRENENLHEQITLEKTAKSPEDLADLVSQSIAAKMSELIYSDIVLPCQYRLTGYLTNKVFAAYDESINEKLDLYRTERRILSYQNNFDKSGSDLQLEGDRSEYATAANNFIDDIRNDGPIALCHLGPLSVAINRPLIILNEEGKIVHFIGEHLGEEPVSVEYHQHEGCNTGYWSLPGGEKAPQNSLFSVVAQQIGETYIHVRDRTITALENNIETIAAQMYDIHVLNVYCKDVLMIG